jgi:hypothetical protein
VLFEDLDAQERTKVMWVLKALGHLLMGSLKFLGSVFLVVVTIKYLWALLQLMWSVIPTPGVV